jgi:hypothetical protein
MEEEEVAGRKDLSQCEETPSAFNSTHNAARVIQRFFKHIITMRKAVHCLSDVGFNLEHLSKLSFQKYNEYIDKGIIQKWNRIITDSLQIISQCAAKRIGVTLTLPKIHSRNIFRAYMLYLYRSTLFDHDTLEDRNTYKLADYPIS